MTESWNRLRARALDSVATLQELLEDGSVDDRRLGLGYIETKRVLADAFEAFATEKYADPTVLEAVKRALEQKMAELYPGFPPKYLRVRGFGEVHSRLLAYLSARAGADVTADELRMLTGDAVHTERRARELRDLGMQLEARESGGANVYILRSAAPDAVAGARLLLAKNIREDGSINKERVAQLLGQAGLS